MRVVFVLTALLAAGCTLGPDYHRPEVVTPAVYRQGAPWQEAQPRDGLDKGTWWHIYNDAELDNLQRRARAANQQLGAAIARVEQARAVSRGSRAEQWPRLDLGPSLRRGRTPADLAPGTGGFTATTLSVPFELSYEIDLWGRVRRQVETAGHAFVATMADFENVLLTLQAEVARNYFNLRTVDAEIVLLEQTLELRRRNLELVANLFRHGQVGRLDLARAETEMATTEAEMAAMRRQRANLEHALAVLVGEPASHFALAAEPLRAVAPAVAPGLPSQLLERRPDIAAAERRMAAANARIGIAKTAFFPAIRLTGSAGYASGELSSLFDWDNRTWGVGPFVSLPIFDAGRNRANLARSEAAWEEAVSDYRQQVLVAFAEVEDALSDLRLLDEEAQAQQRAVVSARQAADISAARYRSGLVSFLEVVDSERTALATERAATRLLGQQLQASVSLIKALGGGWDPGS
jgi:outer membrane protein, multidrug efflux system